MKTLPIFSWILLASNVAFAGPQYRDAKAGATLAGKMLIPLPKD